MPQASIPEWISALSSLAATIIAGFTAYYAYQQYLLPPSQEAEPDRPNDQDAQAEQFELVVFETSKQQTLLKATQRGLECWLLNKRTSEDKHQWSIGRAEIARIVETDDVVVSSGYKAQTGLFKLGERRNWLYSKKLFPEPDYLHGALFEVLNKSLNM